MNPTEEIYQGLMTAYDRFNDALFGGELPSCLLTLQREKATCGYFSANRFARASGEFAHELAMNPSYFGVVPLVEVLQTLCHELSHLWQIEKGTPARGRYHNREFAEKMESIGLMTSTTGRPDGARTGDRMSDYPIRGGRFLAVCEELMSTEFSLAWYDRFPPTQVITAAQHVYAANHQALFTDESLDTTQLPQITAAERIRLSAPVLEDGQAAPPPLKKQTREKYICSCANAVWGRPNLKIRCEDCSQLFWVQVSADAAV